MKFSKYLFVLRKGFCSLIYNCKTDTVSAVDNQLADLIEGHQLDYIEQKHQDFYVFLKREGFIVEDDVDECADIIETWKKRSTAPLYPFLSIPPWIATSNAGIAMKSTCQNP